MASLPSLQDHICKSEDVTVRRKITKMSLVRDPRIQAISQTGYVIATVCVSACYLHTWREYSAPLFSIFFLFDHILFAIGMAVIVSGVCSRGAPLQQDRSCH